MRDHIADNIDFNASNDTPQARRGFDGVQTLALLGALTLIAAPFVKSISRRWRVRHPLAMSEPAIDRSLKDTYPASDPPASRYFDIPDNRQ